MLRPFGRRSDVALGDHDPFTSLRREMDRLFDSFGRDVGWPGEGSRPAALTPSIDVSESEGELKIDVDLPGGRGEGRGRGDLRQHPDHQGREEG
jgi:HSP20 family molecular chaperone IbpA